MMATAVPTDMPKNSRRPPPMADRVITSATMTALTVTMMGE